MNFEIIGPITDIESVAMGNTDEAKRVRKKYGERDWNKFTGNAMIRLQNGRIRKAEIHWYESDGAGPKEFKRKRYLD
ncbi:MAG: hypothetical protein HUU38_00910 [Anaerolineales bacterium]|jgi:hypothetical protein|nr:hypothetical protein [Anaerolineales bacterium]